MYTKEQERWNAVLTSHWWGRGHYAVVQALIADALHAAGKDQLRCLDIGCGGGVTMGFLKRFGKVCGFDISCDGLAYNKDRGAIVQADAMRIPFKDELFDVVTILDVVEHVDEDDLLFEEAYRIAKKNALIFINVPAFSFFWRSHDVRYGHKRRYLWSDLERLARNHLFTIEKIQYLHAHFFMPLFLSVFLDKLSTKKVGTRDDFISLGPIGDRLLLATLLSERWFLRYGTLPFGISLFCILRK